MSGRPKNQEAAYRKMGPVEREHVRKRQRKTKKKVPDGKRHISTIFEVRKVAERKFPEFFKFSSRILYRILLRSFPEFFEEFLCFVWETETRQIHQKSPPFFNAKFPGKLEDKKHKFFWRAGKVIIFADKSDDSNIREVGSKGDWRLRGPKTHQN